MVVISFMVHTMYIVWFIKYLLIHLFYTYQTVTDKAEGIDEIDKYPTYLSVIRFVSDIVIRHILNPFDHYIQ